MGNTYSQIYIQFVFAVKGRTNLIHPTFRTDVQKYITGIAEARNCKMLAIYCMPDHAHILVRIRPTTNISDLVRDIKGNSTHFINQKKWLTVSFAWQNGFGAFSYNQKEVIRVINYIRDQEIHHGKIKFKEEYFNLIKENEIEYKEEYLFEWYE
ncbi:MAG: IS200/IS605 family transposase [Bacteroidia bacterium]|jgi:putative transposase